MSALPSSSIFVVGTVRSGSTLIARCLGLHPDVCYPKTAHFELSPEWCSLAGIDIAAPITGKQFCPPLRAVDATEAVRKNVSLGFSEIHQQEVGHTRGRFLNKSPHLWNKLGFVRNIFPDAHLVVTCRDIFSTIASTKELFTKLAETRNIRHYLPNDPSQCWECIWPDRGVHPPSVRTFPGGDVSVLAEYWLNVYRTIERDAGLFDVVVQIRHREFVNNSRLIISSIHNKLGLASADHPIPALDLSRNERWRKILTAEDEESVRKFIEENYETFSALKYADTIIASA